MYSSPTRSRPPHKTRYIECNRKESGKEPRAHWAGGKFPEQNTRESQALRSTIEKWDFIKLKSFCKAKDSVNRTKWWPTECEKIFTNPTSDRGIISNIYKELKELNSREPNNYAKNGVQSQTKNSQLMNIE